MTYMFKGRNQVTEALLDSEKRLPTLRLENGTSLQLPVNRHSSFWEGRVYPITSYRDHSDSWDVRLLLDKEAFLYFRTPGGYCTVPLKELTDSNSVREGNIL